MAFIERYAQCYCQSGNRTHGSHREMTSFEELLETHAKLLPGHPAWPFLWVKVFGGCLTLSGLMADCPDRRHFGCFLKHVLTVMIAPVRIAELAY